MEEDKIILPLHTVDMIVLLDKTYPERCADLRMSDREIWFKSGQRSVVNHLLALKQAAEEEDINEQKGQ